MGKTYVVAARVDEETYRYITGLCEEGGMSISGCLRRLIESARKNKKIQIVSRSSYGLSKEMVREVNRIGVNINQIARGVNNGYYTEYEKERLLAYLKKILEIITEDFVPD